LANHEHAALSDTVIAAPLMRVAHLLRRQPQTAQQHVRQRQDQQQPVQTVGSGDLRVPQTPAVPLALVVRQFVGLCTRRADLSSYQSPNGGQQTTGAWHIFYTRIPTYLADGASQMKCRRRRQPGPLCPTLCGELATGQELGKVTGPPWERSHEEKGHEESC
jgi:hypothetical protein